MQVPVLIVDSSRGRLRPAIQRGIDIHQGEILAEHARFEADLTPYRTILSMTIDTSYNVLVTQSFAPEFGYQHTFSIPSSTEAYINQGKLPPAARAHLLFDEKAIFTELNRKINTTYTIKPILADADNPITKDTLSRETTPLFIKRKNEAIEFITQQSKIALNEGDQLVILTSKK